MKFIYFPSLSPNICENDVLCKNKDKNVHSYEVRGKKVKLMVKRDREMKKERGKKRKTERWREKETERKSVCVSIVGPKWI
jgi:hypothetical protein